MLTTHDQERRAFRSRDLSLQVTAAPFCVCDAVPWVAAAPKLWLPASPTLPRLPADITPYGGHNSTDLCGETGSPLSGKRPTRLVPGPRTSPLSGDWDPTAKTGDGASAHAAAKTCEYLLGSQQTTGRWP